MSIRSLSTLLDDLQAGMDGERVSVSQILETFHERGFGAFLFLFALPAALPVPAAGLGTLLALPLILLTAQQAAGRHTIWLPERIKQRSISRTKLEKTIKSARPWIQKLEKLLRPRLEVITQGKISMLTGALGFIMALSVSLPLPLTNTVPALGIALMAVGVLVRDGLAILVGAATGISWIAFLAAITLFLGTEGITAAKEAILSLL